MPRRPTCMNINETLLNRGNILSRLMVIVFGVAVLTLAACATATPSPASDIPGGAGTGGFR